MIRSEDQAAPEARHPRVVVAVTDPMSAIFFRGQLAFLQRAGFDMHFISALGPSVAAFCADQGAHFHPIPLAREAAPIRDVWALIRLIALFDSLKPRVVNAGTPKAGLLVTAAAWLCRIPHRVYTIRGLRFETATGWRRKLMVMLERLVCALATEVVCVGHGVRETALNHRLCAAHKARVLGAGSSNGIDVAFYHPDSVQTESADLRSRLNIPVDAPVLAFVGRMVADKGIRELLGAWHRIRTQHSAVHLVVAGDFEHGNAVTAEQQDALRRDERVHILGFIKDVRPVYAMMSMLVLPTYREGLPGVLLEAGAMAKPVVATAIPGCRDVVIAGRTGTLVPVADAAALAAAIDRYVADPQLAQRHGENARAHVGAHFAQRAIWQAYAAFYSQQCSHDRLQTDVDRSSPCQSS